MELSLSCHHPGCNVKCANFRELQDHLKTHLVGRFSFIFHFAVRARHFSCAGAMQGYRCHYPDCSQAFETFEGLKVHLKTHEESWVEQEWGDLDGTGKKKKKKGSKTHYTSLASGEDAKAMRGSQCCWKAHRARLGHGPVHKNT